jgi:hypothetical protein
MVGTALLVVFGAGAVVAALQTGNGKLDYAALGIVSFSFALAVAAAIYMFGSTSGAHINPAVTVSLAAVRRFPWGEVVPYIVAQLIAWPGSSSWIRTTCSATRSGSPRSKSVDGGGRLRVLSDDRAQVVHLAAYLLEARVAADRAAVPHRERVVPGGL